MAILAYGINHRTASVDLRSRLSFPADQLEDALGEMKHQLGLQEVALLSTCNRTELYCTAPTSDTDQVLAWLGKRRGVAVDQIARSVYEFWDEAAVRHLIRVASGLDSLVLGEPQIFGQLKSAYALAQQAATVGPHLGRLFQHSFSAAKQIRSETGIGANPVSVAFASVKLAQRIFSRLSDTTVLLIGAGETIELVARHLSEQGVKQVLVANRTLARANAIAEEFAGQALVLEQLPMALPQADIVISSTASPVPILGKGTVEQALKKRRHEPVLMIDIAVPRDIEEAVDELDDVYLYTVDDLQQVVEENRRQRQEAANAAEKLVHTRAAQYMEGLKSLDAVQTIRQYRQQVDRIRERELARALADLEKGIAPDQVLERLSRGLMNKVMHTPTTQLKAAAEQGRQEQLAWAAELLGIKNSQDLD